MHSKRLWLALLVMLGTCMVATPTIAATPSVCAQATAAENAVAVSSNDPATMVSRGGRASKLDANCAAAYATMNQSDLALVTMAGSFHFANVAAMGMHLEGDNVDAARLLRQTQGLEARYARIATTKGSENSQQILRTISNETDLLASSSWGSS
jgi:hypothetical protein